MTRPIDRATARSARDLLVNLGDVVFYERRHRGLTRDELADVTGLSLTTIKNIETSDRLPTVRVVLALLDWLATPSS